MMTNATKTSTASQAVPREVVLGDVCEVIAGQSPPSKYYNDSGDGLPFYQGKADFGELHPKTRVWCSNPVKIALERDILFCVRAPVGPTNVATEECCIGRGLAAVRAGEDIDHTYLLHFFRKMEPQFQQLSNGSTFKAITKSDLVDFRIPLPPLEEQKRIAAILDKADALRRKRAQALQLTDQFLQSLFLDMFGDPVTNPKGWETKKFGSLCERLTVGIVVKPASYYVPDGVPALRSLNIKVEGISKKNFVYVSPEANDTKLAKTKLKTDDLVIVRSGQPGTSAIIPQELDGSNAIDILIASLDHDAVAPIFLCHFMNSGAGKRAVLRDQRGQIQKHLNVGQLKVAELPVPPLTLQKEFAKQVRACEASRSRQRRSEDDISKLIISLSSTAFQGEL